MSLSTTTLILDELNERLSQAVSYAQTHGTTRGVLQDVKTKKIA